MRSFARQSARLASKSQVRQSSRSRRFSTQQPRNFSTSVATRVDNRGPSGTPEHSNSLDPRREETKEHGRVDDGAKQEGEGEEEVGDAKGTENRMWRFGSRSHRDRRSRTITPDIPKPPPIPQWFLDHNVKLQADPVKPDGRVKHTQNLRCVDQETGHTLFTVPYYGLTTDSGSSSGTNEDAKGEKQKPSGKKSLERSFFDNKFEPPAKAAQSQSLPPKSDESNTIFKLVNPSPEEAVDAETDPHDLIKWALLEAETSVRAAFTMAGLGSQPHSQAASRVDVSLSCPDSHAHDHMDHLVEYLAAIAQANIIRLDANDFSELSADYVGRSSDSPGSISNLAYEVFDGYALETRPSRAIEENDQDEMDEDEDEGEEDEYEEDEDDHRGANDDNPRPSSMLESLRRAIYNRRHELGKALGKDGFAAVPIGMTMKMPMGSQSSRFGSERRQETLDWDEARLRVLLDSLLDAPKMKAAKSSQNQGDFSRRDVLSSGETRQQGGQSDASTPASPESRRNNPYDWRPEIASALTGHMAQHITKENTTEFSIDLTAPGKELPQETVNLGRTIVHVRDLKDLCNSKTGEVVVRNLVQVVQKRRLAGEEIVVVGSTAQDSASGAFLSFGPAVDENEFRKIKIPPWFNMRKEALSQIKAPGEALDLQSSAEQPYRRILEINARHLQSMLRRLRPEDSIDLFAASSRAQLKLAGNGLLSQKVLSFDQIQRLVLTAVGLSQTHARSQSVTAAHLGLATYITSVTDRLHREWSDMNFRTMSATSIDTEAKERPDNASAPDKRQAWLDKLKKTCNSHESKLLPGVVDAQNIKSGFNDVHAPADTLDALKTLTSLSLLRPDAFKYGVLATDRLPGIMLYGPPGTGKTLLAKAVAKESRATVLEISGAQIYEKYVGEGEKMVRAVFSLAKKLSPCIVFIDEGDAIFGSRSSAGNRNTHREIINQFLREWDGMSSHQNVLMMLASNRPFDIDDAVLRRLPRRLLVDLPVAKDRESILKIHLKDEILDETVSLADLAEQTPLYSGSDLKNLCVAAALACVREENDLVNSKQDSPDFKLPEKRTLSSRHFEKAIKEISASISEDMSSLTAIRKFDEQYGDRRGRRKKTSYGFGMGGDEGVDESAARVRQSPPPP